MRDQDLNDDAFDTESMRGGSLFEYVEVLRRRWLVVLIAVVVVTTAGVVFARSQRKMYASSSSLAVSTSSMSGSGAGMAAGGGAGSDILTNIENLTSGRNVETQAAILSSPDLLSDALTQLTVKERWDGFGIDQSGPQAVPKWAFDIEQKKNVDVITVDDPDHFTKPFSVTRRFAFRGDLEATAGADGVTEYSCEENNRNVPDASGVVTTEVKAQAR